MTATTWPRVLTFLRRLAYGVLTTCLLAGATLAFAPKSEDTLLVWASDKEHVEPDFIAVIDFESDSPTYGKVLRTVPLSGRSAVGNEPHHVGLSRDGRTMALGGLLSVLRGQDQVFFFDVSNRRRRSRSRHRHGGRTSAWRGDATGRPEVVNPPVIPRRGR